jgi:hypothetical protein
MAKRNLPRNINPTAGRRWSVRIACERRRFRAIVWLDFAGSGFEESQGGLGVDYTNGGFLINAVAHAPVMGLAIRF